ncbi:MAG: metallophosphoesterase family protein [Balneola sp.]
MPRIALISDPHANLTALKAVIKALEGESPDLWLCMGDLVGYGPDPSGCIDLVREKKMLCVKGNHDAGVTGELSIKHFRDPNRTLIEKTKELISEDQMSWLRSLPLTMELDNWVAAHASPIDPSKWKYVESAFTARDILNKIKKPLCFIGHTHKPALVSDSFRVNTFKSGNKYLINPGSVGQSRDGDYRASCALVDTEEWTYKNFRVEFDLEPVLTKLMKLGFTRREAGYLMKI